VGRIKIMSAESERVSLDANSCLSAGRFAINSPDIVTENFDGQVVILNLANGHYFSLEGIAGRIWTFMINGYAPDAIAASIRAHRPELAEGAIAFMQEVNNLNLVIPVEDATLAADAIVETWSGAAPHLVVYEDLAELIYADPIHDVDEQAGWPVRPKGE
jgi:flagellar basal body P-ring protein FlgI